MQTGHARMYGNWYVGAFPQNTKIRILTFPTGAACDLVVALVLAPRQALHWDLRFRCITFEEMTVGCEPTVVRA